MSKKQNEVENEYKPDSLTLWLAIEINIREHKERVLKMYGLNWDTYDKVKQEAITQVPEQGIDFANYHVAIEERTIREYPLSQAKVSGTKKHISLHLKR